jgi:poly-beta-1,6-N-acetyl-D-glucosamine synthase
VFAEHQAIAIVFWVLLGIILYTYFGYGFILVLITMFKNTFLSSRHLPAPSSLPMVTVIIPAYNETSVLARKVNSILYSEYPEDRMEILLITDGSTDGSENMKFDDPEVRILHQAERQGKSAAINRAVKFASGDIIIITDANAITNREAIWRMVRHFSMPEVGGVSGEKRVVQEAEVSSVAGEGIYWKYESLLKNLGARLYSIVGAAGELFAFRRVLFEPIEKDTILDDFVLSMKILKKGYRIAYEPGAYSMELPSKSIMDEFHRKVRISSGVFQALPRLPFLFNPLFNPILFFQFISHRFLRWTLAPLALVLILFVNIGLLETRFYYWFFFFQIFFYVTAVMGYFLKNVTLTIPALFVPFYFCMMNVAVFRGLVEYMKGRHSVLWKKAER